MLFILIGEIKGIPRKWKGEILELGTVTDLKTKKKIMGNKNDELKIFFK